MKDFLSIQFILSPDVEAHLALGDLMSIMREIKCPLPTAYYDTSINALLLVWVYEKNKNEQAWDVLHHVPYLLFYKCMKPMVLFYNKYKTTPIISSSEHNYRLSRFGNPHMFIYIDRSLLNLDNTSILYESSFDYDMYISSVHDLLVEYLDMFNHSNRMKLKNLDIGTIYTIYKKIESILITMVGNISEDDINRVENALDYINDILVSKFNTNIEGNSAINY